MSLFSVLQSAAPLCVDCTPSGSSRLESVCAVGIPLMKQPSSYSSTVKGEVKRYTATPPTPPHPPLIAPPHPIQAMKHTMARQKV